MKPWLLETAEKYKGRVNVVAVDVDNSGELAQSYKVEFMPTFVLLKDGEEINRLVGTDTDDIISMMEDAL